MGRKRKKGDDPEGWDLVAETQDPDAWSPLFETVAETQDPDATSPPFETVPETQDPDATPAPFETVSETQDADVEAVSEALSQLQTTPEPIYRLKDSTKDTHSSVICKLTRVLRLPELLPEIKRTCVVMKQLQLEGWHLANLHVLRCLKESEQVPDIDQMFFYRCCAATIANHISYETKYPSFHKTCVRYWAGRDLAVPYAAEEVVNGSRAINEMARLMKINALNMIALHFRRRLHQYIRFRYAPEGKTELKYRETKRLVDSCFRVKSVPEKDDDGNLTGRMVKVWKEWDETEDETELALRAWLGIVPWQWLIRDNSAHFVRKLYDMLTWMEAFVGKHPTTKGARVYSLLPVATSFQAAYVKINASTLHGIFSRVKDQPKVEEFLKNELNIVPTRKMTSDLELPFTEKTFQKHKSDVMRAVFDVNQFETENRKFVDEVKTNGYAASVTMIRPLTTTSVVVVEKKSSKKKKTKKNDGTAQATSEKKPKQKKVKTPEELADGDSFAKELFKLGSEYSPDVLIGIDPGMRSLVTAVSVGRLPRRRRQRRRRGRNRLRPHMLRPQRSQTVMEISTREYRHLARMNDFRFYNENLKKREPWYGAVIRAMPSFKTSSYETYFANLRFFWAHLRFLLAFSAEQSFLPWRFTQDRAKMKALDTLAKRLVPKASKQVCIAYGDWSRRDGIKGHATGPVKGFVEALKKRATVLPMDEYRTSITCSCCHQRLKHARLFTKMKRKKDEEDIRTKERPSKKEVKEIAEMGKFRKPRLADQKVVLKCTRNVLRCINSRCKANFWNRDVNAARNMLELLRSGLKKKRGATRLRAFRRGQ